jgi:hypothetical protein
LEKIIEIEMDFPFHYTINEQLVFDRNEGQSFNEWFLEVLHSKNQSEPIYIKVVEIVKKYKLQDYFIELGKK